MVCGGHVGGSIWLEQSPKVFELIEGTTLFRQINYYSENVIDRRKGDPIKYSGVTKEMSRGRGPFHFSKNIHFAVPFSRNLELIPYEGYFGVHIYVYSYSYSPGKRKFARGFSLTNVISG